MQRPVSASLAFRTGVSMHFSPYWARKVHLPTTGKSSKGNDVEYFDIFTDCDSESRSTCSILERSSMSELSYGEAVEKCSKGVNTDIVCVDELVCMHGDAVEPSSVANVECFDIYTPMYTDCESENQSTCSTLEHSDVECSSVSVLSSKKDVKGHSKGRYAALREELCDGNSDFVNMHVKPIKHRVIGDVEYYDIYTPVYTDLESDNQSTCSTFEQTDVERSSVSEFSSGEGDDDYDSMCRACSELAPAMCRTCADSAEDWFAEMIKEINSEQVLMDPEAVVEAPEKLSTVTRGTDQPFIAKSIVQKPKGQLPQTDIRALRMRAECDKLALERIQEVPVPTDNVDQLTLA